MAARPANSTISAGQRFGEPEQVVGASAGVVAGLATDRVFSIDQKSSAAKLTSPLVTTTYTEELVLAFISADGPYHAPQHISHVTGAGLTWSLAARANGSLGTAEVWQAYATSKVSGVISAYFDRSGFQGSMTIQTFTGARRMVAAIGQSSAQRGRPTTQLVPSTTGGIVMAAAHDWDLASVVRPTAGQTLVHWFRDKSVNDSFWVQRVGAATTAGVPVSVADESPTNDKWEIAAVEIAPLDALTATSVALAVSPGRAAEFTPVTLTATVTPDSLSGTVQVFDGGVLIGSVAVVTGGSASLTTSGFGAGPHHLTAIFVPDDTADFSTSPPSVEVVFVALAVTGPAPDIQPIETAVRPGSMAISTPYTAANPLVLPRMTLNAAGTMLSTSATFGDGGTSDGSIKVVDTSPATSWTASAISSKLVGASGGVINAQNVGLTGLTGIYTAGNAVQSGSVVFTDFPAAPGAAVTAAGSAGLGGCTPHAFASAGSGVGTVGIFGRLTVNAPSSTIPGEYTGTITFTIV